MYEFTVFEKEPEPQTSGRRSDPPRKHTGAGVLEPSQFPSIRPKCFGCSQPLAVDEISEHILSCDSVSAQDLGRFKIALAEVRANPSRAREVVADYENRIGMNHAL